MIKELRSVAVVFGIGILAIESTATATVQAIPSRLVEIAFEQRVELFDAHGNRSSSADVAVDFTLRVEMQDVRTSLSVTRCSVRRIAREGEAGLSVSPAPFEQLGTWLSEGKTIKAHLEPEKITLVVGSETISSESITNLTGMLNQLEEKQPMFVAGVMIWLLREIPLFELRENVVLGERIALAHRNHDPATQSSDAKPDHYYVMGGRPGMIILESRGEVQCGAQCVVLFEATAELAVGARVPEVADETRISIVTAEAADGSLVRQRSETHIQLKRGR